MEKVFAEPHKGVFSIAVTSFTQQPFVSVSDKHSCSKYVARER